MQQFVLRCLQASVSRIPTAKILCDSLHRPCICKCLLLSVDVRSTTLLAGSSCSAAAWCILDDAVHVKSIAPNEIQSVLASDPDRDSAWRNASL